MLKSFKFQPLTAILNGKSEEKIEAIALASRFLKLVRTLPGDFQSILALVETIGELDELLVEKSFVVANLLVVSVGMQEHFSDDPCVTAVGLVESIAWCDNEGNRF